TTESSAHRHRSRRAQPGDRDHHCRRERGAAAVSSRGGVLMALPVRNFIIQRLLEFDPNFDVGSGVPTTGLMIDPLSIILQPIVDELSVAQASQSILTILESSDPDSFPEDIVDGLASNALVERIPGAIGSDVERIRFFAPTTFSAAKGVL